MTKAKLDVKKKRRDQLDYDATRTQSKLNAPQKRSVDLAKEKGASSWLMALPLEDQGFALYKSAFWDPLAIRYNWLPVRMPTRCACNEPFTVEHALSCPKGAFPIQRHNEIWDITCSLLSEVSHVVTVEPTLQPLDGHTLRYASAINHWWWCQGRHTGQRILGNPSPTCIAIGHSILCNYVLLIISHL